MTATTPWLNGVAQKLALAGVLQAKASNVWNFVSGVTAVFNTNTGYWDLTVAGGSGGHVIKDEGTPLTARANLNFVGVNVTVTDDGTANTIVTIGPVSLAGSGVTGTLPFTKGGTGLGTLGTALQSIRVNAGATALEFYTPSAGLAAPVNVTDDGKVTIASGANLVYAFLVNANVSATAAIALTKLADGTACTVVTRAANSTGAHADLPLGTNGFVLLRRTNTLLGALLLDENVDPAAAVAGTKIAPDFGAQVVRTTGQVVAATSGTPAATTDAGSFESCTTSSGSLRGLCHRQASADANGARVVLQKSRGTHASPAAVALDDHVGSFVARAHDGSGFNDVGVLRFVADDAGGTSKRTRFESMLHNGSALVIGEKALQATGQTTNGTLTTIYSIPIAADDQTSIAIRWSGKQSASSNRAFRETTLAVRRSGSGSIVEYAHSDGVPLQRDDLTWGTDAQISYALNNTTHAVDITVQGKAATTIDWTIDLVWSVR